VIVLRVVTKKEVEFYAFKTHEVRVRREIIREDEEERQKEKHRVRKKDEIGKNERTRKPEQNRCEKR
jgi:hypothetical protein